MTTRKNFKHRKHLRYIEAQDRQETHDKLTTKEKLQKAKGTKEHARLHKQHTAELKKKAKK